MLLPIADICRSNSGISAGGLWRISCPIISLRMRADTVSPEVPACFFRCSYSFSFSQQRIAFSRFLISITSLPVGLAAQGGNRGLCPLIHAFVYTNAMLARTRQRAAVSLARPLGARVSVPCSPVLFSCFFSPPSSCFIRSLSRIVSALARRKNGVSHQLLLRPGLVFSSPFPCLFPELSPPAPLPLPPGILPGISVSASSHGCLVF